MCMSAPAPPPMPAAPSTDAQEALTRVTQERQKAIAAAGLGSTIITGGLGASDYGTTGASGAKTLGQSNVV
jgi:hypothetical protein